MKFIYGEEEFFINYNIDKIKKEHENTLEKFIFDESSEMDEIYSAITNFNLFNNKRLIIIKNFNLLVNNVKNNKIIDSFIKLLNNIDEDIELVFTLYIPKIKQFKGSELFNFLIKKAKVQKYLKLSDKDIPEFIKKYVQLNNATIENEAIYKIAESLPNNLFLITSLLDKHIINNNRNITSNNITSENEIFYENPEWIVSDAILKNNSPHQIFKKIMYQLDFGINIRNIIIQVSNIFTSALEISILQKKNSLKEISLILGIHEYRIKLISDFLKKYDIQDIKDKIQFLSQLDLDIKNGLLSESIALDYLILNLFRMDNYEQK